MVTHKGIATVVTKARLSLSASLRKAVHLRAERTTLPQELVMLIELLGSNVLRTCFFFLRFVSLPLIYVSAYFTPITASVGEDTVLYQTLIRPKDDIIPFLSLLVSATPPFILLQVFREELEQDSFSFM